MVTLVINPGSSSKKYAFYKDGRRILVVRFEKTAEGFGRCTQVNDEQKRYEEVGVHMYREAFHEVLSVARAEGIIKSVSEITKVGLRIVAPGTFFQVHREIDELFIRKLIRFESVLPLHIPPTLEEIASVKKLLPNVTFVGVSDSAFHHTIPEAQYAYSLRDAKGFEIRRYGYHGLSVSSLVPRLPEILGEKSSKVVVAHIGSGASVTGLLDGVSIYNSMGYTPASGMMMGSRAGDIDPGALIELLRQTDIKLSGAHRYIQTNGGFAGLLGVADLRTVLQRESQGDKAAATAMEMFLFDIQSTILKAITALQGIDALVLTATAMERNQDLRARLLAGLGFVQIAVDEARNESVANTAGVISPADAPVVVAVIPTNEMGEMARAANETGV